MGIEHPDFATFGIGIQATEAGIGHTDDVIALVFAHLALIREKGIDPRRYDELARMARIGFRFQFLEALLEGHRGLLTEALVTPEEASVPASLVQS